ncbi:hypothetical protein ACFQ08_01930, partial [Streptosporangium algeriense]
ALGQGLPEGVIPEEHFQALGASAVGVAGHFLAILADHGTTALVETIGRWHEQLRHIMTVLGTSTPDQLAGCDLLLTGDVAQFCHARGIDPVPYSTRSNHT